jgi:hypothetical protein
LFDLDMFPSSWSRMKDSSGVNMLRQLERERNLALNTTAPECCKEIRPLGGGFDPHRARQFIFKPRFHCMRKRASV